MSSRSLVLLVLATAGCGNGETISAPHPVSAVASGGRGKTVQADTPRYVAIAESLAARSPGSRDPAAPSLAGAVTLVAARAPAGGAPCASAPLGDEWRGTAVMRDGGSRFFTATRADVRWVRDATNGCIDRYHPTGTIQVTVAEACHSRVAPSSAAIAPGDGVLVVDRTTSPAAYAIRGATTWDAAIRCKGARREAPMPVGGPWALASGTFDGELMSGAVMGDSYLQSWRFRPADDGSLAATW